MRMKKENRKNKKQNQRGREEFIKNRARKYFIEQKLVEIGKFVGTIILVAVSAALLAYVINWLGVSTHCLGGQDNPQSLLYANCDSWSFGAVFCGIVALFTLSIVSLLLFGVIGLLAEWIEDNWNTAKLRAVSDWNQGERR